MLKYFGISIILGWKKKQLLIIQLIVLLFGTQKVQNIYIIDDHLF